MPRKKTSKQLDREIERALSGTQQKRAFYESMGYTEPPRTIVRTPGKDYGSDPLGNGMFRMVPSGDVVDIAERERRLPSPKLRGW